MKHARFEEGDATRELLAALLMLGNNFTPGQFSATRRALGIDSDTTFLASGLMGRDPKTNLRWITPKGKQYLLNEKEK